MTSACLVFLIEHRIGGSEVPTMWQMWSGVCIHTHSRYGRQRRLFPSSFLVVARCFGWMEAVQAGGESWRHRMAVAGGTTVFHTAPGPGQAAKKRCCSQKKLLKVCKNNNKTIMYHWTSRTKRAYCTRGNSTIRRYLHVFNSTRNCTVTEKSTKKSVLWIQLNFPSSGSTQKFRIHADLYPDPTHVI